jgi:hypothetical protein
MQLKFKWEIQLDVAPDQLWQYVADTNSLNKAAGLSEWKLRYVSDPDGGSRRLGETRHMDWKLKWGERPFGWIEGRRYSVVRTYQNGPARRFDMAAVLEQVGSGTRLVETITIEPRWLLMAPAIYLEAEFRSRRSFERVYRQIEQHLKGQAGAPFQAPTRSGVGLERIERLRSKLAITSGADYLPKLIDVVTGSPDVDLDRLRAFPSPISGARTASKS